MIVAVLWVVGLTNAYNFMDGIDGISGAQAIVAGVAFALAAAKGGLTGTAVCAIAIAAANAGFLIHNWSPARVFMGDVGSAFLGFSFAVMALEIAAWSPSAAFAAALSLWPFILDTSLTFLRRAFRGENVFQSHRSHLYQRLVIAGWSHARVTVLYALTAALAAAAGLAWVLHLTK
jgi:UDP-N-acetylmuramyl pentapeptide phosphotransferase/UDP-N-acetylglucosamine-1-phosphate transferase